MADANQPPATVIQTTVTTTTTEQQDQQSLNAEETTSLLKDSTAYDLHSALAHDQIDFSKRRPWGDESGSESDSDEEEDLLTKKSKKKQKRAVAFGCFLCLCIFVAVVVTGSWLSADTSGASSGQIAGYALLTVAGIVTFFLILACCTICLSACAGSMSPWQNDFKEFDPSDVHQRRTRPVFIFKHWNDEYRMDATQHESLLRLTAKTLPKEARAELKKAMKEKKEADKKRKEELKKLVVGQLKTELKSSGADPMNVIRKLRKRVYVVDFYVARGATVEKLSAQVTLILKVANPGNDVVVFRIESPGGFVSVYGLAAAQIMRLRNAGFRTIASIDEMAASGGYMMASVCHEIYAAPFSFVGSIGVITYIPNLERVTKETLKVDVYRFTAGKYKRTVDIFGEVTEEDKTKLISELELIHTEFKEHVKRHRGSKLRKDIDDVATGEGWLAANALEMGLVDKLITSDQALMEFTKEYDVLVLTEFKSHKENLLLDLISAEAGSGFFAALPERFLKWFGVKPSHNLPKAESQQARQHRYELA